MAARRRRDSLVPSSQATKSVVRRVPFRLNSIRIWGWLTLPLLLVAFSTAHGLSALLERRLALGLDPWLVPCLALLGTAFLLSKLSACPRCGRSSLRQSDWLWVGVWPVAECSKCGLDLRRARQDFRTPIEEDEDFS